MRSDECLTHGSASPSFSLRRILMMLHRGGGRAPGRRPYFSPYDFLFTSLRFCTRSTMSPISKNTQRTKLSRTWVRIAFLFIDRLSRGILSVQSSVSLRVLSPMETTGRFSLFLALGKWAFPYCLLPCSPRVCFSDNSARPSSFFSPVGKFIRQMPSILFLLMPRAAWRGESPHMKPYYSPFLIPCLC